MQRSRKLYLSIFNYENQVVCDLYDNQADIEGQATNVFINKERNGWKELTFDIPSTCMGAEGIEENFRLKYLIAEYKIRVIDDEGTDWYIISEPKITRNAFSKNVSVRAGHISQLLKHKSLDLEFSDDEGNNVGRCEDLLETILEGTDWTRGNVGTYDDNTHQWITFLEDDGSAKKRSMTAQAGTGALALIEKLCDLFEAKPVYHGDTHTIDILPMNPFAKVDVENIPSILRDSDADILELYYNRNVHDLDKTTNTENMATRLYAYGSSGDLNGACTLQSVVHNEWHFVIIETGEEYRFTIGDSYYYFKGDVDIGDELVWSDMDLTSMSYIYNETKEYAYKVYRKPTTEYVSLETNEPEQVENEFPYLLGLTYYNDVGLMTDTQFQEVAKFQRDMPPLYKIIKENSENFIESEAYLSKLAQHSTGLLKLSVQDVDENCKIIINTSEGEHGVLYRTDYDVAERRYFQWHIAKELDNNGDPITGTPSVLFVVHDTNPVTYDMVYLKEIWDNVHGLVKNEDGELSDFQYSTGVYPTAFTVWSNNIRYNSSTDRFYLFCTNSMSGLLGSRLAQIEAVYQDLINVTMKHDVIFLDYTVSPTVPQLQNVEEYAWLYHYYPTQIGDLYFAWPDKYADSKWYKICISDLEPQNVDDNTKYFYNTRNKTLWRFESNEWQQIEDKQITVTMFESVIYYCLRRDELYNGIYEYYYRNGPLETANYAIHDGYNGYWTFKLNENVDHNLCYDYTNGLIHTELGEDNTYGFIFDETGKPKYTSNSKAFSAASVETRSVFYPSANELDGKFFYPGTITNEGTEETLEYALYRTGFIELQHDTEYTYKLPDKSWIYFYNENQQYVDRIYCEEDEDARPKTHMVIGYFSIAGTGYIRVVVPDLSTIRGTQKTSYIKPINDKLVDIEYAQGTLNEATGAQITDNTYWRTDYIVVDSNTEYMFTLPYISQGEKKSKIFLYKETAGTKVYDRCISLDNTSVAFTTRIDTKYIRVAVPEVLSTNSIVAVGADDVSVIDERPFTLGSLNENGEEVNTDRFRTYTIDAYEETTYQYNLPAYSTVYYYNKYTQFISYDYLTSDTAASGTFTTPSNTAKMRFVTSVNALNSDQYVRIEDYRSKFYMNRECYNILDNIEPKGEIIGITPLTKKFADTADVTYTVYVAEMREAQEDVKQEESDLAILLGDMLKDGRWQDTNYIKGDEKRLYDDALYMLRQVSQPEVDYSFTYLDMFGTHNEHYYEEHDDVQWPDIDITYTAHLIDEESNTNCWAYIDKINKCYDQPWRTTVDIDTKLTLASRHGFTDVIARIAEVAKEMKAKQSLYDTAVNGRINGSRLEGVVDLNQIYLNGGSSNWWNDEKGNLIFEAADGLSAMMLGGRGFGIATEKDETGQWLFRTAGTGYGLTADVITAGLLSADRIDAGTITLEKLASNVGKELEISSNNALLLFATEDGSRPAGSLKTTDGYIEIVAGQGLTPAKINVVSGGELNMNGGKVNIYSDGEMNVGSGGKFTLKSNGADSMESTASGLFIDSERGINFAGGRFKVEAHGNTAEVYMKADYIELGKKNDTSITMDADTHVINVEALNAININSGSTITLKADETLSLITNGQIKIGKTGHLFTIGADSDRTYIYYNLSSLSSGNEGIYIGTDGFALKQNAVVSGKTVITQLIAANGTIALTAGPNDDTSNNFVSVSATDNNYRIWAGKATPSLAPFSVTKDGTLYALKGTIGGFSMDTTHFSAGTGTSHVEINTDLSTVTPTSTTLIQPYAIWTGADSPKWTVNGTVYYAPFSVTKSGKLYSVDGDIGGFTITKNQLSSGSGNSYVALNSDFSTYTAQDGSIIANHPYAIWCGNSTAASAPFRVSRQGAVYMTNATITGGSITIKKGSLTTFQVTNEGKITSIDGSIAGWTITADSITKRTTSHNKEVALVGMASASLSNIAFWAGADAILNGNTYYDNLTGQGAKFRVTHGGIMYAKDANLDNASITGGTFKVQKTISDVLTNIIEINHVSTSTPEGDGRIYMRAGGTGGGWMMDPNDFAGPWKGTYGSVDHSSTGFVQLNCNPSAGAASNPRISVGAEASGLSPFRVYSNGSVYAKNITMSDAFTITSLSTSSITGVKNDGTPVTASFFSSSHLSVGKDGSLVYPTYHDTPYKSKGITITATVTAAGWTTDAKNVVTAKFNNTDIGNCTVTMPTGIDVGSTTWGNSGDTWYTTIKVKGQTYASGVKNFVTDGIYVAKGTYDALVIESNGKTQTINALRTQVDTLNTTITGLNATITDLNSSITTLQNGIRDRDRTIDVLREELNKFSSVTVYEYVSDGQVSAINPNDTLGPGKTNYSSKTYYAKGTTKNVAHSKARYDLYQKS